MVDGLGSLTYQFLTAIIGGVRSKRTICPPYICHIYRVSIPSILPQSNPLAGTLAGTLAQQPAILARTIQP